MANTPKPKVATERKVLEMLKIAAQRLDIEHVRELLDSKPNLNTNFGGRLLSRVVYHASDEESNENVVALLADLVKTGAKLNMTGTEAYKSDPESFQFLHIAASRSDNEQYLRLAILMIDHGADVNARNEKGDTALHIAARIGSVALAEALVENGADVEAINECNRNAIQIAIDGVLGGITKADVMLPLLIKSGNADEKTIQRRGLMAYKHSLYEFANLTEPMKVLFDLGIAADALDDDARCESDGFCCCLCRPLNYAAYWPHLGTVKFLGNNGADINKDSKCGRSPIIMAFLRGNPVTIPCVIRLGADVNSRSKNDGLYPLHIACKCVDYPTPSYIKLLFDLDADINVTEKHGKTPLAILVEKVKFGKSYEAIIKHLAFLLSNAKKVNENDLKIIDSCVKAKKYYEKCSIELNKMKATAIYNDISVFHLIANSDKALSLLLKNNGFRKSYNKIGASFRDDYPEYFAKLKEKIRLAKRMRTTLDTQTNVLNEALHEILPKMVLDKIIDYASAEDIKILKRELYLSAYRSDLKKAGYRLFDDDIRMSVPSRPNRRTLFPVIKRYIRSAN